MPDAAGAVELLHAAAGVTAAWELLPAKAQAAAEALSAALALAREAAGDEPVSTAESSGPTPPELASWLLDALHRILEPGEHVGTRAVDVALWRLACFLSEEGVGLADVQACRITYPYDRWKAAKFAGRNADAPIDTRRRSVSLAWIEASTRQVVVYVRTP